MPKNNSKKEFLTFTSCSGGVTQKSPFKIKGWRDIHVLFLGGERVCIVSRFFATHQRRAEKGKGFHPGLALLGVSERLSPATLDLLAKNAAALGSMHDAQTALADQGIDVSTTRISTAVRAVALKAKSLRTNDPTVRTAEIQGRKVTVHELLHEIQISGLPVPHILYVVALSDFIVYTTCIF